MRIFTGWLITLLFFVGFAFMLVYAIQEVQQVQSIENLIENHVQIDDIHLSTNSYMYDRNGEIISEIYQDANRIYLTYEEIPQPVLEAFLSIEDHRFFEHKGYDPTAIVRAFLVNMKSDSIQQGASTVTQQVVKNMFLSHEQTFDRKFSELLYAFKLEEEYSKEKILELYFNSIFFQNGVYGFEAASHFYFSRTSHDLSLAEIAFLGAIPNNPTLYNPLTNIEKTHERKQLILSKMLEANYITEFDYQAAIEEEIVLHLSQRIDLHPDYTTYVHHEFKELIAHSEGYTTRLKQAETPEQREKIQQELTERVNHVYELGVKIETHLDPELQENAIQSVARHLPYSDIEGAAVLIHHPSHAIVAITGGKNYKKHDFHRAFQAYRQPGSAIKPLLVYGPYLSESGVSIQSPVNANNFCKGGYCPRNFGGGQYGNVTIQQAFINSYNTPAVRLLDRMGIESAFRYLEKFEFSELQQSDYTLSAGLGGFTKGMTPLEMTNAYTTFANQGTFVKARGIKKVTDLDGNLLYKWDPNPKALWGHETNDKLKTLLNRTMTNGTGKKAYVQGSYVGGKTGTTDQYRDIWFIGSRDEYTAGVWVGKDNPASLQSIYSTAPQQLIWRDIMRAN